MTRKPPKSPLQRDAELIARLMRTVHQAVERAGDIRALQACEQLHRALERAAATHGIGMGLDVQPLSGGGPKPQ